MTTLTDEERDWWKAYIESAFRSGFNGVSPDKAARLLSSYDAQVWRLEQLQDCQTCNRLNARIAHLERQLTTLCEDKIDRIAKLERLQEAVKQWKDGKTGNVELYAALAAVEEEEP